MTTHSPFAPNQCFVIESAIAWFPEQKATLKHTGMHTSAPVGILPWIPQDKRWTGSAAQVPQSRGSACRSWGKQTRASRLQDDGRDGAFTLERDSLIKQVSILLVGRIESFMHSALSFVLLVGTAGGGGRKAIAAAICDTRCPQTLP